MDSFEFQKWWFIWWVFAINISYYIVDYTLDILNGTDLYWKGHTQFAYSVFFFCVTTHLVGFLSEISHVYQYTKSVRIEVNMRPQTVHEQRRDFYEREKKAFDEDRAKYLKAKEAFEYQNRGRKAGAAAQFRPWTRNSVSYTHLTLPTNREV